MLQYIDLLVSISSSRDRLPVVRIESPVGHASTSFFLPLGESSSLEERLRILCQNAQAQVCRGVRFGGQAESTAVDTKEIGRLLFDSIFSGEGLRLYQESSRLAIQNDTGLRIKLKIDTSDPSLVALAGLPWELIYRSDVDEFLCLSNRNPLVRYLSVPRPCAALPLSPPFRVLVLISNPRGWPQLDLENEKRLIQESWGQRSDVQVDFLECGTKSELQRQLGATDYHVFHYMGHGEFDSTSGQGMLILKDDNGDPDPISGESLGMLLADEPSLRLVFLNACNTAQITGDARLNPFSGVASALILAGMPTVLAMQYPISDQAAIVFSKKFYELLPQYLPIDWIVAEARKQVSLSQSRDGGVEWATPSLFMRSETGVVFETIYGSSEISTQQQVAISRLSTKVKRRWVEQKLDIDIPIKPPIELNKELAPKLVQRTFGAEDRNQEVPAGKTIATLFDEKDRSLLILGEPGFGKSTSLFALAQYLLRLFDQNPAQPVPVVLFLSTWTNSGLSIRDWAAREILEFYRISDRDFNEWLEKGRIVLLLDGLDSVPEQKRLDCIAAINRFASEQISRTNYAGVAVCCRYDEYMRTTERIDLAGAIRLRPLNRDQIVDFLSKFGDSMSGLMQFIDSDPQLMEDAKVPLVLGMLHEAYRLAPEQFALFDGHSKDAENEGEDARKSLLVSTYIDRVFANEADDTESFSKPQIMSGLAWLAKRLSSHHQTIFQLEHLQPSWLVSPRQRLLYSGIYGLGLGVWLATIMTVIWFASHGIDPHLKMPIVHDADYYWYLLTPVWALIISAVAVFQPVKVVVPHWLARWPRRGQFAAYVLANAVFLYCVWILVFGLGSLFVNGFTADWFNWMSHAISGGVSVAFLYSICTTNQNELFTGSTEILQWDWKRSSYGLVIGLAVGCVAWGMYYLSNLYSGHTFWELANNLFLYPPFGCAVGLLYGGLKKVESKRKTEPNEGIRLSMQNAIWGTLVIGFVLAIALVPLVTPIGPSIDVLEAWKNGGDANIEIATDLAQTNPEPFLSKLQRKWPFAMMIGLGVAMTSTLWFGGIDVLRHYSLRLTFFVTSQLPWRLETYFNQMAKLSLLQRIGGGYMFRNNLLREHFERQPDQAMMESPTAPDQQQETIR